MLVRAVVRMRVAEREPRFLIENGYLEKLEDFKFAGKPVLASRLGYRITASFVDRFSAHCSNAGHCVSRDCCVRKAGPAEFAEGSGDCGGAARVAKIISRMQRSRGVSAGQGAAAHHGVRGL